MKKILVIATRQIGDVLLTTPLIRAARQQWPDAHIDVIGLSGTLGMLTGNPDIHTLISTQPRKGWRDTLQVLRTVWRRYDLALVTQPSDRAHLIGWAASSHYRSGIIPASNSSNWWKKRILHHVVNSEGDEGSVHVVSEKMSLLAPFCTPRLADTRVQAPPAHALPPELSAQIRAQAIVVHAPSMWPYKQWPIGHFQTLVATLLDAGHQVVLTGSASPIDQECIGQLRSLIPAEKSAQLIDSSGQLSFNQLVALFQRTRLYIGPDTSVTHLAAASGIRVIAVFGPTNPGRWGPWPSEPHGLQIYTQRALQQTLDNVTVLQGSNACVPCSKAGCENHTQSRSDCLVGISPERVIDLALEIFDEKITTELNIIKINQSTVNNKLQKILISYHPFPPIANDLAEAFEAQGIKSEIFIIPDTGHWFFRFFIKPINKTLRNLRLVKKGFDLFPNHPANKLNHISQCFLEKFQNEKPDLVLFIHGVSYGKSVLEKIKTPKIGWWVEPYFDKNELIINSAPFDKYLAYNKNSIRILEKEGINTEYLHHAVNLKKFYPIENSIKEYDIAFVGNWSPWREAVISQALKTTKNIALYGPSWREKSNLNKKELNKIHKGNKIAGEKLNILFNKSKIILNAQRIVGGGGLNMRFFEVPASASCYLTDLEEEIEEHFVPNKHICTFKDIDDLSVQLEKLISTTEFREEIRWSGYHHVVENFSYEKIAKNISRMYSEITKNPTNKHG